MNSSQNINRDKRKNILPIISLILSLSPIIIVLLITSFSFFPGTDLIFAVIFAIAFSGLITSIICLRKKYSKALSISSLSVSALILLFFLLSPFLNSVRIHTWDQIRISDIKQIRLILDLHYSKVGKYPKKLNFNGPLEVESNVYMEKVPQNRHPYKNDVCPENFEYRYVQIDDGESYNLIYCLTEGTHGVKAGLHIATPETLTNP